MNSALKYWVFCIILTFGLGACGKSLTGMLASSEANKKPQPIKVDPLARPIQVAWTSARASRCGFYFDANQLRSSYLAFEAGQGASGKDIKKYQQAYDFTLKTVSKNIKSNPKYCDKKSRVEEIRADLQRHLQGDYKPRPRKRSQSS